MLKKYEFLIIYFIDKGAVETDEFKFETEDELTSCCPDTVLAIQILVLFLLNACRFNLVNRLMSTDISSYKDLFVEEMSFL